MAGFRVEALLGRGGMAYVYLAHDMQLGRKVALKVLSPELAANRQFQLRFHRESRLLASLDHPNIVPVYQAGEADGVLYIAMRYVEGSDLSALLDREGPLDPPVALKVLTQVSAALEAAHRAGLVHRDIKPDNVLISGEASTHAVGHVYLTDFGLTKQISSLSNLTTVGNVMGTMQYLAPEQISGKPVEVRTDIYSLGGLAFRCLTGLPPFEHDDRAALLWAHLSEAPPPVSECRPGLPEEVDDVIWTAMAKAPEDRYASAGEFANALTAALDTAPATVVAALPHLPDPAQAEAAAEPRPAPTAASQPMVAGSGPPSGRSRRPWLLALLGALVVAALVVGVVVLTSGGGGNGGSASSGSSGLTGHYAADDLVPFNVSFPSSWAASGSGNQEVFSPSAGALLPLFTSLGSADAWASTWQQVTRDPNSVIGLYTSFSQTAYDPASQSSDVLGPLLPAQVSFDAPNERTLDGRQVFEREGDLTNPANPKQRLHFQCYIVQRSKGVARTVHLLFIAPAATFDRQRALFDRVAASVHFP
jgi:serine/threonine protein kinase